MSHASASLAAPSMSLSSRIRMLVVILMVVLISEAIGSMTFAVGPGKIVLQPMLWAIFIGAVVAALGQRLPAGAGVDTAMQTRISGYLQYALLPFLAKLGLMVGGALPQVREAAGPWCSRNSATSSAPWPWACRWRCCWASSARPSAPPSRWAESPAWPSSASATA